MQTVERSAETTMETLRRQGFVVMDGLLSDHDVELLQRRFDELERERSRGKWSINDGVVQDRAFWPFLLHDRILDAAREVLGGPIRFCQHNDAQHSSSSFSWHRDSTHRVFDPTLPCWREDDAPYRIIRCATYLQPESHGFKLGFIPGSHGPSSRLATMAGWLESELSSVSALKSQLLGWDRLAKRATWVATRPGRVVFFDPRIVHTGSRFEGRKLSLFTAFGIDNRHFREHYTYYRYLRTDLGYGSVPSDLVDELKARDLYAGEEAGGFDRRGAFVPSRALGLMFRLANRDG